MTDWIVTDSHSFDSVYGKGFIRMIEKFDPAFFQLPRHTIIEEDIYSGYQAAFQVMKEKIIQTCETAAITTNLWTSHENGYIGITCHWLSEKMELYDILICVEQINDQHTGNNFRQTIINKLEQFGLESKVKTAVTDNCSNMIEATREWNVDCVPCSTHALQLCVVKGLEKVKRYTKRFEKLNLFFISPKQNEWLEEAQRVLAASRRENQSVVFQRSPNLIQISSKQEKEKYQSPLKILRTINDIKAQWGTSLTSWKSLQRLRDPIEYVILNLNLEDDTETKNNYKKLKNRNLKDYEWNLLDKLIDVFKPIEEAIDWLGKQKYCTLSLIYPVILALKDDYIPDISIEDDENMEIGK